MRESPDNFQYFLHIFEEIINCYGDTTYSIKGTAKL